MNEVMIKAEQIRHLKEIMTTYKVPTDLIDVEALVDSKLSYEENKAIIMPLIETLAVGETDNKEKIEIDKKRKEKGNIKTEKDANARVEMEQLKLEADNSEKEFEKAINSIKTTIHSEILEKLYYIPREYIKSVISADTLSLILLGKQARGKSYLVVETLNKGKAKYKYHSGFTSPMALYKLLYENRDEGIINVFDDTQGLMSSKEALPLMLNALYSINEKREIMWNTTSSKLGIPQRFIYEARTILITNTLPNNLNSTLISSRCLSYEFNPTNKQLLSMMYEIAKQDNDIPKEKRIEIVDFMKGYADGTCKNFDLRTQRHIENLFRYDKDGWKELSQPLLSKDESLVLLKTLLKECSTIAEAEKRYCEKEGVCRKTFYNRKALLDIECKSVEEMKI